MSRLLLLATSLAVLGAGLALGLGGAVFALVLGAAIVFGAQSGRARRRAIATHWLRDTELLAWRQRLTQPWEEDAFAVLLTVDHVLFAAVYVAVPVYLVLSSPSAPVLPVVASAAVLLPGLLAGELLYKYLGRDLREGWVALLDSGIIVLGVFVPWQALSHFVADAPRRSIRVYSRAPARPLVDVLLPPTVDEWEEATRLLSRYLPDTSQPVTVPWWQRRRAWLLWWTGFILLRVGWALVLLLLPSPELACVLLGIGFLVFTGLSMTMLRALTGLSFDGPGEGLTEAGAQFPPGANA